MFSLTKGRPIAKIVGGDYNGELLSICEENYKEEQCCKKCSVKCKKKPCCGGCGMCYKRKGENSQIGKEIQLSKGKLVPLPNIEQRSVDYIAGPSGSGKTTHAVTISTMFKKIFPEKDIYLFSRTDYQDDPALLSLRPLQIKINESLIETPIDITKELKGGTLLIFDDCNTIQNEKLKRIIDNLMKDIMEVGRKLGIWIIITNHLVIPDEKKIARCVLNELHNLTIFPQSGSSNQIEYVLKKYFGLSKKQIDQILQLKSRWVTICKNYPRFVIYDTGAFIL